MTDTKSEFFLQKLTWQMAPTYDILGHEESENDRSMLILTRFRGFGVLKSAFRWVNAGKR